MSAATIGWGTILKCAGTAIAEVVTVDPPDEVADDVEVTHLLSINKRKEWIQGMIDGGEFAFTGNFLPGNATQDWNTGLIAKHNTGVAEVWSLELYDNDGTILLATFTGDAYVKRFKLQTLEANSPKRFDCTLKKTGDWTWA